MTAGPLLVLAEKLPDTVVMTFYRDGRLTREICLGERYDDLSLLPRTASHLPWQHGAAWSGHAWSGLYRGRADLSFVP
jgi:hypothetical protein